REDGEQNGRLQIHLPTVALPFSGPAEVLIDPLSKHFLKMIVAVEFQSSGLLLRSNRLLRRPTWHQLLLCHITVPRMHMRQMPGGFSWPQAKKKADVVEHLRYSTTSAYSSTGPPGRRVTLHLVFRRFRTNPHSVDVVL